MKHALLYFYLLFSLVSNAQNTEIEILDVLNSPMHSETSNHFFKGVSSSTYPLSAVIPTTLFTVGCIKKDRTIRYNSYQMAAGLGMSMAVSLALKYAVDRERPHERYPFIFPKLEKDSPSFPSGHATAAFTTATSLSLNYPKWYVIVPAYAWASGVGYSRMYLGIHYPSDILVGAVIGAASSWVTWQVNKKFFINRKTKCAPSSKGEEGLK